ncbi:TetR/AcrR family transcriptional regulator [Chitinolyticbacter albus]|uniref:TetR/AcrR family transcriptional regulator n=1 Tax=Chitinolyticbacter albus TaxID=2961951 RepID=UPI00210987DC|nr:TetR/AcrR family transcriptional regulator [Chitinolyticbacter albus]
MATQAQRSSFTQSRLIEATTQLLAEQGYAALGEARVCERAGVSRGALRHHYPKGRYDLLPLVVQALLDEECRRLDELGPLTPKERLFVMLNGFLLEPDRNATIAILEIWMASRGDAKLSESTAAAFDGTIERLFGHDALHPADAEEVALRCFLHGVTLHRFSVDYDVERLAKAVRWMLDQLTAPPRIAELLAGWQANL